MAIRRVGVYNGTENTSVIDVPRGSDLLKNNHFTGWLERIEATAIALPADQGSQFVQKGVSRLSLPSHEQYEIAPPLSLEQFAELGTLCINGLLEKGPDDVAVADYRPTTNRQIIWIPHQTAA